MLCSPARDYAFELKVTFCVKGVISPLAANIYLNEVDWFFDAIRRKTAAAALVAPWIFWTVS
jgi:hypothetical protein